MSTPSGPAAPRRRRRDRDTGPVTLDEVAKEAGVSLATASRVLNGSTRVVGEALRERVLEASSRLDYSPNAAAQAMARGRSDVVGMVVHDIADPYFSTIAAGVMARAAGVDAIVTLAVSGGSAPREVELVATMRRQRVRAVLLAGSRWEDDAATDALREELAAFRAAGGRVAAITQDVLGVDTVLIDNRGDAGRLGAALLTAGYREFLVLAGPPDLSTAVDRTAGFRDALGTTGATLEVVHCPFTRDGAYAAVAELVTARTPQAVEGRPPCLLAANDVMAVGAMAALRDAGLRVPADVAVAGFDDIPTLRDIAPALTTVRLPLADLGSAAFDLIDADPGPRRRIERVAGEVLLRASTPVLD